MTPYHNIFVAVNKETLSMELFNLLQDNADFSALMNELGLELIAIAA